MHTCRLANFHELAVNRQACGIFPEKLAVCKHVRLVVYMYMLAPHTQAWSFSHEKPACMQAWCNLARLACISTCKLEFSGKTCCRHASLLPASGKLKISVRDNMSQFKNTPKCISIIISTGKKEKHMKFAMHYATCRSIMNMYGAFVNSRTLYHQNFHEWPKKKWSLSFCTVSRDPLDEQCMYHQLRARRALSLFARLCTWWKHPSGSHQDII